VSSSSSVLILLVEEQEGQLADRQTMLLSL